MRFRAWLLYVHAEHIAWLAFKLAQEPEWQQDDNAVYYGPGIALRMLPWDFRFTWEDDGNGGGKWRAGYPHFGKELFRTYGDTELEAVLDLAEVAPAMIQWLREDGANPFERGFTWRAQWEWHLHMMRAIGLRPRLSWFRD